MSSRRRLLLVCGLLYLFGQLFFLINIQFPRGLDFDEFHYVPSAKQFLQLRENQNYEHPPLAKELMAVSIAIWGDRPIGWRFMSTVFGALTLVGMYLWGLALFRDEKTALWVALLSLANHLLYVQSRIGMLDTFMTAFLVFGLAAFTATWDPKLAPAQLRRLLLVSGAMLGLATACKWFGIIPWAFCVGLVAVIRVLQAWGTRFERSVGASDDWFHPDLWRGIRLQDWVIAFLLVPLAAYYVTFLPFLFVAGGKYGITDILWDMQYRMWDGQSRVVSSHPYMSSWTAWAPLKRPIWYAYDKEVGAPGFVRGVVLLGNPWVMWTGLLAVFATFWSWIKERRREAFLAVAFYLGLYLCWAVIPRKVSFYYYYYPAGLALSLCAAYCFRRFDELTSGGYRWARWAYISVALLLFAYFYPILAALKVPTAAFGQWMWFRSWI
ncbi:MAG: phospholipid carrier-dependent glycosyltransferase [Oligoflexia bacterium]|nr:phospholipid carrier-dependent glycosyltransferase [Oligoflexia bacterium]